MCWHHQMLGCDAHVRIIALSHVRCACGSVFGTVRAMCVRAACFGRAMCDRTFSPVFLVHYADLTLLHTLLSIMDITFLKIRVPAALWCYRTHYRANLPAMNYRSHFSQPSSYNIVCTFFFFWLKSCILQNFFVKMKNKVLLTLSLRKRDNGCNGLGWNRFYNTYITFMHLHFYEILVQWYLKIYHENANE